MKLAIPTIADDDLEIANSAEVGAESTLRVAFDDTLIVGELTQGVDVPGSDWSPLNAYKPPSGTLGRDLAVLCANGVKSTEQIVLQFNVHLAGVGTPAATASAVFNPPAYAQNQTFNFPLGLAVDLNVDNGPATFADAATTTGSAVVTSASAAFTAADVGKAISGTGIPVGATILSRQSATQITLSGNATATATGVSITIQGRVDRSATKIRTVDSIAAITGGLLGDRFEIVAFPDSFVDVMCATDKNPTIPVPKSIAIPCGYNGSRWIKKGRSEAPNLEVAAKLTSGGDGLMRMNGHRVTAMIEVHKEDRLLTERQLFGNWRPSASPRMGDGDAEAEVRATGLYETWAVFV
jgi:hypothetical protein